MVASSSATTRHHFIACLVSFALALGALSTAIGGCRGDSSARPSSQAASSNATPIEIHWPTAVPAQEPASGIGAAATPALPVLATFAPARDMTPQAPVAAPTTSRPSVPAADSGTEDLAGLSADEAAKAVAVRAFLARLDETQGMLGSRDLNYSMANKMHFLGTELVSSRLPGAVAVAGGQVNSEDNYLLVRWLIEDFQILTNIGDVWASAVGESELQNLRVGIGQVTTLSDADRANGLDWSGQITIQYITHYRLIARQAPGSWPSPALVGSFMAWADGSVTVPVELRNNTWRGGAKQLGMARPDQILPPLQVMANLSYLTSKILSCPTGGCREPATTAIEGGEPAAAPTTATP